MDRLKKGWATAVFIACLAISWFSLPLMFNGLFGLFVVHGLSGFLSGFGGRSVLGHWVLVLGGLGVVSVAILVPNTPFWPYLAILCGNLGVAYVFANRLFQHKPSILEQIVRIGHRGPDLSPRFAAFLKRQCGVWVGFAMTMALASCVALMFETSRPLVNTLLTVLVIAQLIWFVVSHKIAQKMYGRPERWQTTLSLILKRKLWNELEL